MADKLAQQTVAQPFVLQPRLLRHLSIVPRWSIVRTIQTQTVAEHSFHVAWLCLWLAPKSSAVARGEVQLTELLARALAHDEDEATQGDMPSSAKEPKYEGSQLKIMLKVADCLEALLFLEEETHLGNWSVMPVRAHVWSRFEKWVGKFQSMYSAVQLWADISTECFGHRDTGTRE